MNSIRDRNIIYNGDPNDESPSNARANDKSFENDPNLITFAWNCKESQQTPMAHQYSPLQANDRVLPSGLSLLNN